MHPLQLPARQIRWAAENIALNLDYIADDKLRWKPAATAPSALEIVEHLLDVLGRMTPLVGGWESENRAPQTVQNREDAKARLIEAAEKYRAMLLNLKEEQLEEAVAWHNAKIPRRAVAMMPVNDTIHHHGQIAYIQMLLGDEETHMDRSALIDDNSNARHNDH